jgi:type II secretory pathway component PulF
MPDFFYRATDASGTIIKGIRSAKSVDELALYLQRTGFHLLDHKKTRIKRLYSFWDFLKLGSVSRRDLIDFSNNIGTMLKSGVSLAHCLSELHGDMSNRYFKKIIEQLLQDITSGDSLNVAMARAPNVFPELYVNVVSIGEATGSLDKVFFDLARHLKRLDDLVLQTRKALIYPFFVLVTLFLLAYVYLSFVFPLLFTLLEEFDTELPQITIIIQSVSVFMQAKWFYVLTFLVLLFFLYIIGRRTRSVRYCFDWCELNIPVIKKLFIGMRMAFFMRYMSMLLGAGIDMLRGMELSIKSTNNLYLKKILNECLSEVAAGAMVSDSFRRRKIIPNMVTRMISVGEEAGTVSDQMEYVADQYEEDLARRINWAFEIMGPMVIFILAGMALLLIMGVMLPIYDLVGELSTQANQSF